MIQQTVDEKFTRISRPKKANRLSHPRKSARSTADLIKQGDAPKTGPIFRMLSAGGLSFMANQLATFFRENNLKPVMIKSIQLSGALLTLELEYQPGFDKLPGTLVVGQTETADADVVWRPFHNQMEIFWLRPKAQEAGRV